MQLKGKLLIEGQIEVLTGLSIGGSNTDVVIGGIDNSVIKTAEGVPYIPGSSLKGKLRSLTEKKYGRDKVCECGKCDICAIYGMGAGSKNPNEVGPTRLYVRDARLDKLTKKMMEEKEGIFRNLELEYTEGKWENTIDRKTSEASNPRQTERVPVGARFDFDMVYNILEEKDLDRFNKVILALKLLEDDYLGGNGSRGYGRIKFINLKFLLKTINDYEENNEARLLSKGNLTDIDFNKIRQSMGSFLGDE